MVTPRKGDVFKARDVYATTVVQDSGQPFVWCLAKGFTYPRCNGRPAAAAVVLAEDHIVPRAARVGWVELGVDLGDIEIVPADQVPDEVWAKLALLRLTGDAS